MSPAPDSPPPVELALAATVRLRLLGTGLGAIGVVVALGVVLMWATGVPAAVAGGLVVLGGLGVLTLGVLVGVRHWVLRMDADGYRVRALRPEARAARWTDVLDVQARSTDRARLLVLRLRDGRTTALPVDSIEGGATRLTELVTEHLDRGHGYRRLR